jgi:DNA-binding MarR family transcriptional regulator
MTRRENALSAKDGREAGDTADPAVPFAIGDTDDVSRQGIRLGFLIHDVSRMRRNAYDQVMKPLGVTRAQWWVLAHLSRHDGMMQTELADVLDVGKASLGTLIERLEAGGWVERRADPTDKRAKRVYLARSGQQLVRKMTLEENRFNDRILHELSGSDREQLIRLLAKIKLALSQYDAPDSGEEQS